MVLEDGPGCGRSLPQALLWLLSLLIYSLHSTKCDWKYTVTRNARSPIISVRGHIPWPWHPDSGLRHSSTGHRMLWSGTHVLSPSQITPILSSLPVVGTIIFRKAEIISILFMVLPSAHKTVCISEESLDTQRREVIMNGWVSSARLFLSEIVLYLAYRQNSGYQVWYEKP